MLVARRDDRPRALLLGDRLGVVAADRTEDELAEQRALVFEAGVDRFLGDSRLCCDGGDARALVAPFREQHGSGIEHPLAGLLGLLASAL